MRGESNISRQRGKTILCLVHIIIPYVFSPTRYIPLGHLSFLFFYWTYLSSVRRIIYIYMYRVERVSIHVHSFFMITTICSHLRQKSSLFVFLSLSLSSSSFCSLACSFNCRYVFPETTLPRRQIPEYRLCVCVVEAIDNIKREILSLHALHFFFCLNWCW